MMMSENHGKEIYLARHGALDKGPGRHFVGQMDFPLNSTGTKQAEALRDALAPIRFSRIVTSDLIRTKATADLIAQKQNVSVTSEPAFREVCLGAWEGLAFQEVMERYPVEYDHRGRDLANHRPPGGESFRQVADRAFPVFTRLAAEHGSDPGAAPLLIVTHVGVIRTLLCRILGLPLENMFLLHHDYGAFTRLQSKGDHFVLLGFNSEPRPNELISTLPA